MTAQRPGRLLDRRCQATTLEASAELGLEPRPMHGQTVVFEGTVLTRRRPTVGFSTLRAITDGCMFDPMLDAVIRWAELAVHLLAEEIGSGRTGTGRIARPVRVG
jgi:hypothetical protein